EVVVDAEIEESADVQGRQVESQAQIYQIDLEHADKVLSMQDDELEPAELQEVVEVVTTALLEIVAIACDIDEIKEVNANCILMANLQQASTSGTQNDKALLYDSDGSFEVHHFENCYDNEIFNMFTQEEQYTELLEPITEPHPVQQDTIQVVSVVKIVKTVSVKVSTVMYKLMIPQVMYAAKLLILNPNEFDLWKTRIKQYFPMIDYSLWEVILNGDSPIPTRVIKGVVQPVAPTTAEQRLARKNELTACGTLLMALHDKHQLKLNIHKDAKTLMEAIEKRFGGNKETKKRNKTDLEEQSLDGLFNSLKIYKAEVKSSSSASTFTQNIAFVSSQTTDSTNDPVSVVASVSTASAKIHISAIPNVDTLSNAVIYLFFVSQSNSPQLDNDDLKQIDANDLEEMDLKWQMAMLTVRARRFLQRTGRNLEKIDLLPWVLICQRSIRSKIPSCPLKKSPCSHSQHGHLPFKSHYDKLTNDLRKSQFDVISYKTGLEYVEARLLVYQQNETIFEEDIKLLKLDVQLRDNALVVPSQKFEKAEQKRDELQLKLEKFQTFFKELNSETDESLPASLIYDRYHTGEGYHVVPSLYTGTFMPPKLDLVFHDVPNINKTVHTAFNVELSPTKPDKDMSPTHRPSAPIIKDWVSDSEDDSKAFKAELPYNAPSFVQYTKQVTKQVKTLRPSVKPIENSLPSANQKTTIPKPKSHGNS
nr:hypothetical protein [Tanacetum cinerariifolium]